MKLNLQIIVSATATTVLAQDTFTGHTLVLNPGHKAH